MIRLFFLFLVISCCKKNNIEDWNDRISKVDSKSQKERFLGYSKLFLGEKYSSNPIKNKIYNLEEVDCITYIHNIFALSKSNCYSDFIKNITETTLYNYQNIKNDNDLILQKRHFTMLDYILGRPNNNYFEIVTKKIFSKTHTYNRIIMIDKKSFFKKIYSLDTDYKKTKLIIEYVDAKKLKDYYSDIVRYLEREKVLILLLVPNKKTKDRIQKAIGSDIDISHLGIIFLSDDRRIIFRHASMGGRVLDIDLEKYTSENILSRLGGFSFVGIIEKD